MKSVLISIKPKWCGLIANGKKTIEVRKTRPKYDTPFKCYIYCTKDKFALYRDEKDTEEKYKYDVWKFAGFHQSCGKTILGAKVIGEFVCDEIYDCRDINMDDTCITVAEWLKYTKGHKGKVYGWHISDLVIYDKPKSIKEFYHYGVRRGAKVTRPPQSWCYCEEVKL